MRRGLIADWVYLATLRNLAVLWTVGPVTSSAANLRVCSHHRLTEEATR